MAKVFISHSSRDDAFAKKLFADLRTHGHDPWLAHENISVGQCIVTEVQRGISEADYVAVVLSPRAVASNWVEVEWKTKYWEQIQKNCVRVLPILLEHCAKPVLLEPLKHADFSENYVEGFKQLLKAINRNEEIPSPPLEAVIPDQRKQIYSLLAKMHSGQVNLSQCIAEALPIAEAVGSESLAEFCRHELAGWNLKSGWCEGRIEAPSYRVFEVFYSLLGRANLKHPHFYKNTDALFDALRLEEGVFVRPTLLTETIPALEDIIGQITGLNEGVLHHEVPAKALMGEDGGDHIIHAYFPADTSLKLLQAVRRELTSRLMSLLGIKSAN